MRFALLFLIAVMVSVPALADDVDVALVLAVDVSGSITPDEARLQRDGYADALESAEVVEAVRSGMIGRIAVAYVEWADPRHQHVALPWTVIGGPEDAGRVARSLRGGVPSKGLNTAMASGLQFAGDYLETLPWHAERRVIDVSGDGTNNMGKAVGPVRDAIVARGITINGLPIVDKAVPGRPKPFDLAGYYRREVIGGPGAFIVAAEGRGDFAAAVRAKIALEVAGTTVRGPLMLAARY